MNPSRRKFLGNMLGGAGCLVALPVLTSLLPKAARAAARPTQRLVVYYVPNGRHMPTWRPAAAGRGFVMPAAMQPFEALRPELTVLSGLANRAASASGGVGPHAKGTSTLLTSTAHGKALPGAPFVSMDQMLARAWQPDTRFESLQWGGGQLTSCDGGPAPCSFTQAISWAQPNVPLGPLTDARAAFDQMFAGFDAGATAAEQQARQGSDASVLDAVVADAKRLQLRLGSEDRSKLEDYFTSVRQLERKLIVKLPAGCAPAAAPGANLTFPEQIRIFNEMMVLALRCDQTRIITFMLDYDISYRAHTFLNSAGAYHTLSHPNTPATLAELVRIETWQAQQAASFALQLKGVQEDGATLLDNTALLYAPSMGQGSVHDQTDLCMVLLGRAAGGLKPTGNHLALAQRHSVGDLHLALLAALGVRRDRFGTDGMQPIAGL